MGLCLSSSSLSLSLECTLVKPAIPLPCHTFVHILGATHCQITAAVWEAQSTGPQHPGLLASLGAGKTFPASVSVRFFQGKRMGTVQDPYHAEWDFSVPRSHHWWGTHPAWACPRPCEQGNARATSWAHRPLGPTNTQASDWAGKR